MALTAGEHIARPISMNLAGLNVDEGGTMTDAEARKAVRRNLLHGMMQPMLLMGLATAGLFCEVRGLRSCGTTRPFLLSRLPDSCSTQR